MLKYTSKVKNLIRIKASLYLFIKVKKLKAITLCTGGVFFTWDFNYSILEYKKTFGWVGFNAPPPRGLQSFNADSHIASHSSSAAVSECCFECSFETLFSDPLRSTGTDVLMILHTSVSPASLHSAQHAVTLIPFCKTSLLKRCVFAKWANRTSCHRELRGERKPLHQSRGFNSEWQFVTEECHWGRSLQETPERQQSNQP